jgi:cytochrome oxidase assembly protein ShyY1
VATSDWSFARRPFWLFSHVLALALAILFVNFGFWQLGRHQDRRDLNELIENRANPPAGLLSEVLGRVIPPTSTTSSFEGAVSTSMVRLCRSPVISAT